MRVRFVLPYLEVSGGVRAVFEIADALRARGHDAAIVVPERSVLSRRNDALRRLGPLAGALPLAAWRRNGLRPDWFPLRTPVVPVRDLEPLAMPDGDAIVATAWQTAERIFPVPARAGAPFYFLQHYEVWSGPAARVDATWRLPWRGRIASSEWLRGLGRERFGIEGMDLVVYGVNAAMFHPDAEPRARVRPRVGMLYHRSGWKGIEDGLEAVRTARDSPDLRAGPGFDLVLFGVFPPGPEVPADAEFHRDPRGEDLRRLYASLDVFLCPSREETGPMTVPEAMACGAAVVSTAVGNVPVWSDAGRAALVTPPGDPAALAGSLVRVLADRQLRHDLAERGRARVAAFTWERTAGDFEAALQRGLARG